MKRVCSLLLILLAGWTCAPDGTLAGSIPGAAFSAPVDDEILEGLSALHQGRFNEGQKLFRRFLEGDPADPRGHLFLAFAEWWKLLELRGVSESSDMEYHLQEAIRLAQERLDKNPGDPETLASLGTGYIFLAQYRASQKKVFRAAFAAKKGKSLLEKAFAARPDLVDTQFGLGAYNYYADKVNILVKGLRTLLFLPGGNSELGLSQLGEVAEKGRYFRTEAHLLLAVIYQGSHEHRYLKSQEHLRAALDLNPGSPVILMSVGELQIRLGRYPEAQQTLHRAMEIGLHSPDRDQREIGRLSRILLADSLDLALHSQAALTVLRAAVDGGAIQPDIRSRALAVATRAAARTDDGRSLERIYHALEVDSADAEHLHRRYGSTEESSEVALLLSPALDLMEQQQWERAGELLEDLQRRYPGSAEVRFHRARVAFEEGRWKEAEEGFRGVLPESGKVVPAWVRGWSLLFLGRSLAAQGKSAEGRASYSKAQDVDGFRARDLARALLGPEGEDPAVWPRTVFGLGIEEPQDAEHVGAGLPEGGNPAVPIHRFLSGVVGG